MPRPPSADRQRFWHEHLQRARAQGLSIAAYAAANDLAPSMLYKVQRRLRAQAAATVTPKFVRVEAPASSALPCRAHLRNGVTVELGVSSAELGVVLRELAALS